jgi:HSP20 family protein
MSASERESGRRSLSTRFRAEPLNALRQEIDELVSRFFGGGEHDWGVGAFSPTADLSETPTSVEVSFDLPGVNPDEIDIQLQGTTLLVGGERIDERETRDRTFHRVERRVGRFSRRLTLPCEVDEEHTSANYQDGVLTISLPKRESQRGRRIVVRR